MASTDIEYQYSARILGAPRLLAEGDDPEIVLVLAKMISMDSRRAVLVEDREARRTFLVLPLGKFWQEPCDLSGFEPEPSLGGAN